MQLSHGRTKWNHLPICSRWKKGIDLYIDAVTIIDKRYIKCLL